MQIPVITGRGCILLEANQTGALPTDKAVPNSDAMADKLVEYWQTVPLLLLLQSIRGCMNGWDGEAEGVA